MGKRSPIRQTSRACQDDDDAEVDEGDDGEEYCDLHDTTGHQCHKLQIKQQQEKIQLY